MLGGAPVADAASGGWVRPVPGPVAAAFDYDERAPFAAGRRRTLGLRSRVGEPVRAACSGTVVHAGATPASGVVSLRCGGLHVVHAGVVARPLARGGRVRRGAVVATAERAVVSISVRRAGDPFGYLDPAGLLPGTGPAPPPPVAPPPAARPRTLQRLPRARLSARRSVREPRPEPARGDAPGPGWPVWSGVAVLSFALLVSPIRRARQHRLTFGGSIPRGPGYWGRQIAGRRVRPAENTPGEGYG